MLFQMVEAEAEAVNSQICFLEAEAEAVQKSTASASLLLTLLFICFQIMYEEICNALGVGMNMHLQKNYLVREMFSLGAPLLEAEVCCVGNEWHFRRTRPDTRPISSRSRMGRGSRSSGQG